MNSEYNKNILSIYVVGYKDKDSYVYASVHAKPIKAVKLKLSTAGALVCPSYNGNNSLDGEVQYYYDKEDAKEWLNKVSKYKYYDSIKLKLIELIEVTPDRQYGKFNTYYIPKDEPELVKKQIEAYEEDFGNIVYARRYVDMMTRALEDKLK